MSDYILFFETIEASDIGKVGGKGTNLGILAKAGFNVPSGFCVTTKAFEAFMEDADTSIFDRLADISLEDLESLREIGEAVRSELDTLELPQAVQTELIAAWQKSGASSAYAIRSSATAEDLPHASFAGQQDSFLNVKGEAELLEKVKQCFISLFTDRAILYRMQNGFDHRQVLLSVVVQQMVQSEVSGILFTADPVSGNRDIASIDASFGLGEALVSGIVSADLFQVSKLDDVIVKRQIAEKKIAIRSLEGGGTETIKLEGEQRQQAALIDVQAIELAQIGTAIENHYGSPQDIEWALVGDEFYITQSRQITSLFPIPSPAPTDGALAYYFSMSHFQMMTDPMPPLSLSILRSIMPFARNEGDIESNIMQTAGGRIFANVSPLLRHPVGKRMLMTGLSNADQLAANAMGDLAKLPDFKKGKAFNPLILLPRFRPYIFKMLRMLFFKKPEGVAEETTAFMNKQIQEVKQRIAAEPDLEKRLELTISEMQNTLVPLFTWAPKMAAGVVSLTALTKLLKNKTSSENLAGLGRGLIGNVTTDMNMAVGDLADAAKASPDVKAHLLQTEIDAQTRLDTLKSVDGGETFLAEWQSFIDTYGSRGPSEIDLSRPRWAEDPTSLLHMVISTMEQGELGAHRTHFNKMIEDGNRAAEAVVSDAYKGWLGWLHGPIAKRFVRVARNLPQLREHHKFMAIQLLAEYKKVWVEAGEVLATQNRLEDADDVWFLTIPEILQAVKDPDKELKTLISERKADFEHYQKLTPPRVISSRGEIPYLSLDVDAPEGALVGSPVSAGVIEGVAKVILDPSSDTLNPGEILVAPFTDPGWTPLFVNAVGLVTEVGGLMTHGSVVAREYGIPAVVGVVNATTQISTGQRIRVHGEAGYIELLDDVEVAA